MESKNNNESKNCESKNTFFINDDLLKKYIHEIRNTKKFDRETLININNLSYEDRLKILNEYNNMMEYFQNLFDEK